MLGVALRSNAAEPTKLSVEEQKELASAAVDWVLSLDEGKYAETFAAASESFRKGSSVQKWKEGHAFMQKNFGPVVSRDPNFDLKRTWREEDGKDTVTYILKIRTKFEKKSGIENVKVEKESGKWKVADYTIEVQL